MDVLTIKPDQLIALCCEHHKISVCEATYCVPLAELLLLAGSDVHSNAFGTATIVEVA